VGRAEEDDDPNVSRRLHLVRIDIDRLIARAQQDDVKKS